MSGGVDSSVAAAMLLDEGHDVVGATMKLWGGASDSGCCSVADVEDARRVAQQLGIVHHVFNFTEEFDERVVAPYVRAHAEGRTPNPCIECNRHLKFDRFLRRATQLGFDAIATGHHARVVDGRLLRGRDAAKDQSYVLSMLTREQLACTLLPVGELTKAGVRDVAARRQLRTATKADSQDVCFIMATDGGREAFLGDRIPLRPGRVVDSDGRDVGRVPAVELVTLGQRRGLGAAGGTDGPRYVTNVDVPGATITVGTDADLLTHEIALEQLTWVDRPLRASARIEAQVSAHGSALSATFAADGLVVLDAPVRRVAPGQTVALYEDDAVVGAGIAR
jgi:tRNA-specific 2-thiouridylase